MPPATCRVAVTSTQSELSSATAEPQQVVADRPVTAELGDERIASPWIDKAIGRERSDRVVRLLRGKAEHQFQVGIRAESRTVVGVERPDVHSLPDGIVEAAKQLGSRPAGPARPPGRRAKVVRFLGSTQE